MKKLPWVIGFVLGLGLQTPLLAATGKTLEDYHLSVYEDGQGQVSDIELFTKNAQREAFFGVTCSAMSPLPMLQIILFNQEVLLESPRLLQVSYWIDGKVSSPIIPLQGVLTVTDSADEYSNKVRLELDSEQMRGKSFTLLQAQYQTLLKQLAAGANLTVILQHKSFGEKRYEFSLQGLKTLLAPYQAVCH